ncbi:winged helix DNA-binding domain-containing protein [Nocardia nova]|uniref:winged helix DNA-binding domain-containing protein n=1 Tax=Nocardia nova TaxID=37330 RepID=UPI00215831AD|nr:winged helix DNA-binding domain-containing protein [Nocardia nova]
MWSRISDFDPAAASAGLENRSLVRITLMRTTIHLGRYLQDLRRQVGGAVAHRTEPGVVGAGSGRGRGGGPGSAGFSGTEPAAGSRDPLAESRSHNREVASPGRRRLRASNSGMPEPCSSRPE